MRKYISKSALFLILVFVLLIGICLIGTSCKSGATDVEYVELKISNSTPDPLNVRCSIDYTSWHSAKDGDKSSRTVTVSPYSDRTMKLAYNPDTTNGFKVGVSENGTDTWFRYHYRDRLSSLHLIYIKKTKDPDNLYKISVD